MHAHSTAEPRFWEYRGPADTAGLNAVRDAVREAERTVWMPGPDTVTDPGGRARFCLLAGIGDRVVGYTWADWWTEVDGTRLYLVLGWVAPAWRRNGIGTAMLRWQEDQAAELAATHGGAGPAVLGGNADDREHDTRALLLANGYTVAFTVVHMTRDLTAEPAGTAPPARVELPAGIELRPVTPGQHRDIHRAIEECFADNRTGYVARSLSEYRRDVRRRQSDTGLWVVAWDGDQVAGVVINEIRPNGTGLTPWVAVREPWRRRGLGRALMSTGLARLSERGVTSTDLSTVAESPHGSLALYQSLGYRVTRCQPRYRKPISPCPDGPLHRPPQMFSREHTTPGTGSGRF
ncbi:MAG TPA: GNAT family N-acetyltransferase [Mycobacteriales bacterium]|nr:GNAT family N-acetyltransferase [Mycobacteriales bacterium]